MIIFGNTRFVETQTLNSSHVLKPRLNFINYLTWIPAVCQCQSEFVICALHRQFGGIMCSYFMDTKYQNGNYILTDFNIHFSMG